MILKLGEAGAIRLLVSSHVLEEIEGALCRKAPARLGLLALLLDRSRVEVVPRPPPAALERSRRLTDHPGDVQVLAAAWESGPDYFVTLDREHFLGNADLRDTVPFPIGTPGDFLAWYRRELVRRIGPGN